MYDKIHYKLKKIKKKKNKLREPTCEYMHWKLKLVYFLCPCYLKYSSWTSSMDIIREPVRHAHFWNPVASETAF